MYFQQLLNQRHGCASYLVASRETGEAAVVDPALDTAQYDALLAARSQRQRYVIDTHIHADHVSGARALAAAHGAALCLHEAARTTYDVQPLRDGDELALGRVRLRVLHAPGHRPELIALLVDVREPHEYARGHVPGALSLPQADLASRLDELPRDRPLLIICQYGNRSRRGAVPRADRLRPRHQRRRRHLRPAPCREAR
jgi:glyoxylase-like metal-dependent hydrolase (beta-lactamase superfamily II)